MKPNQDNKVNIVIFKEMLGLMRAAMRDPYFEWKTLDIDYYPPRVERLWTCIKYNDSVYRVHLHLIHRTSEECLFHKHRWPAVFKQISGSYETAFAYSEDEIASEEAHRLSPIAKLIVTPGTYQEMTQTDALHYVKPITKESLSIMLTQDLYNEASYRKETSHGELKELSETRKLEILEKFIAAWDQL